MRLIRTTVPTIAVTASVAALVSGVVVSTVEARHHKPHKSVAAPDQTSVEMAQATADQLNAMTLKNGIEHTKLCPTVATSRDACFTGPLDKPATDTTVAIAVTREMLASLDVAVTRPIGCTPVPGGPWGTGYGCTVGATWHSAPVGVTVFVSDQAKAERPEGAPGLDAMLTVVPTT
jgi:hypothetical protein